MQFNLPPQIPSAVHFTADFDRVSYGVTIYWMAFAQRYYFKIEDVNMDVVVNAPLISSDFNLNLVSAYFSESALYYSEDDQVVEVRP